MQLAHVAKEEYEDADALEASEEGKESEPEDGDRGEASGGSHVRDAEKVIGITSGENGEYDDEATTGDNHCAENNGE